MDSVQNNNILSSIVSVVGFLCLSFLTLTNATVSCPCLVGNISEQDCANQACPSQYATCGVQLLEENKQEGDFNFSNVKDDYIQYGFINAPKVWTSSIVSGPSTYFYPSGNSPVTIDGKTQYEFEKYEVKLVNDKTGVQLTFDANICVNPPNGYTNKNKVLRLFETFPEKYVIALKIVSVNSHGIQFFHKTYVNGAYGGKNYSDTGYANLGILMHEAGHTMEQHRRITYGDSGLLNPAWRRAIQCDDIRTSGYGNKNHWEDMAEFSKIFALSNNLQSLYEQSPERWLLWNETLAIAQEAYPPEIDISSSPSGGPSQSPSEFPSSSPSGRPSLILSSIPSASPTSLPSSSPSLNPSSLPSTSPSSSPSDNEEESCMDAPNFSFKGKAGRDCDWVKKKIKKKGKKFCKKKAYKKKKKRKIRFYCKMTCGRCEQQAE